MTTSDRAHHRPSLLRATVQMVALAVSLACVLVGGVLLYARVTGNLHRVESGALYRAGQLDATGLKSAIKLHGIRSVLNLRGAHPGSAWYDKELAVTDGLAVRHADLKLSANHEPTDQDLIELGRLLHDLPKPLLVHCLGGADRSGLASAIYELTVEGRPAGVASQQLSIRYGHFPWLWSRTGAMDRAFARFAARIRPSASAAATLANF